MRKSTISLNVDKQYKSQIQKIAKSMHISVSALLSLALTKYIKEIEKQEKEN